MQGPRPFDGVWAYVWYESVHKSTGFKVCWQSAIRIASQMVLQEKSSQRVFPKNLYPLLEACMPFYTLLRRHAISILCVKASRSPGPLTAPQRRSESWLHQRPRTAAQFAA